MIDSQKAVSIMKSYKKLKQKFTKIYHLRHLYNIAGWDQAAMMPAGGNEARAHALTELNGVIHQLVTSVEIANLIDAASNENLSQKDIAVLREYKRCYGLYNALPVELLQKKAMAGFKCEHAWRTQRKSNDWAGFEKNFIPVLELTRQEAKIKGEYNQLSPYDAMIDTYEPGMRQNHLDEIFTAIKKWLPQLIKQVVSQQNKQSVITPQGPFAVAKQQVLAKEIMGILGFDFNHGRLDISTHPFCGGVSEDVRITTRYFEDDFFKALMGVIHETGHACYEQGLPRDTVMLPVGQPRSYGIHESQSLLFEMQIGRSESFLTLIAPLLAKTFGEQSAFSAQNIINYCTRVKPGLIRVDADELTYPLHIILRYEIEQALIAGDAEAADIPDMWNEKMRQYFDLDTSGNFSDGPMQDCHWTDGSFGYFPSYSLGAMNAAQQFASLQEYHPNVQKEIAVGNLDQVHAWLKQNIWSQGSLYLTDDLMQQATGEKLNPQFFKQYLEKKYLK